MQNLELGTNVAAFINWTLLENRFIAADPLFLVSLTSTFNARFACKRVRLFLAREPYLRSMVQL